MAEILNTTVSNKSNTYLSIIERENSNFGVALKKLYLSFTNFRGRRLSNNRYVLTRYHLVRLAKKLKLYKKPNYCFSHSGKYSAVLFSPDVEPLSIDIEPMGRTLSGSLKSKIRTLYADLGQPELVAVMILESLVKLSIFSPRISLSKGLADINAVKIIALTDSIFRIVVNNSKVYSKIYTFEGLYICVTLKSNQFRLSL